MHWEVCDEESVREKVEVNRPESDESELCTGERVTSHRGFDLGAGNAYYIALPPLRPSTQSTTRNTIPEINGALQYFTPCRKNNLLQSCGSTSFGYSML